MKSINPQIIDGSQDPNFCFKIQMCVFFPTGNMWVGLEMRGASFIWHDGSPYNLNLNTPRHNSNENHFIMGG